MEIDPRGPRFGAVITVVVLAVVLLTGSAWLLAAQTVVFAVGALAAYTSESSESSTAASRPLSSDVELGTNSAAK